MRNTLKKSYLLLLLLASISSVVYASHFRGNSEINIDRPLDDNAYLAGGSVIINAPIQGDLLCAGGQVSVKDTIFDDAFIGGGNVDISGVIKGDLRIAGGEVEVTNRVGGDLIITGGQVYISQNAVIEGDLILGSGDVEFAGMVKGNIQAYCGNLLFDGTVERDAKIMCGEVEFNGTILGDAVIAAKHIDLGINPALHGRVEYWTSKGEMDFGSTLKGNAELVYNPDLQFDMDGRSNYGGGSSFGFWIWRVLAAGVFIALLSLLFKSFFEQVGEDLPKKTVVKLLSGLLYFVGIPILVFMFCLTVIGIPVGLLSLFIYLSTIIFAKGIVATVGAFSLKHYLQQEWNSAILILVGLGIFIALALIGMIPFIGTLASIAIACVAFGAIIWQWIYTAPKQTFV